MRFYFKPTYILFLVLVIMWGYVINGCYSEKNEDNHHEIEKNSAEKEKVPASFEEEELFTSDYMKFPDAWQEEVIYLNFFSQR